MEPRPAPRQERRRHRRFSPEGVRLWCVSAEFEELYTAVNFGRRLVNVGLGGVCVETTGRLRPQLKMSVELRFEDLGMLRAQARILWVDTVVRGGEELHTAGLGFSGRLEATQPVRAYLSGKDPHEILEQRQADYEGLKRKADARKADGGARRGGLRRAAAILFLLPLAYVSSYSAFVLLGRRPSPEPGLHYRYVHAEETLAKFYAPAYWAFRKAGVPLVYDPP